VTFWQGSIHPLRLISHRVLPLVAVIVVVLVGAPLFSSWEAPAQPHQASYSTASGPVSGGDESSISSPSPMLAAPENYGFDGIVPNNNLDNENEGDDTSDSLDVLGTVPSLVLLLLGGRLLLACCEVSVKPPSVCCLALKRPG
jgi:hypothetical protein